MSDENWPEFGNAPECPRGFVPDYKLAAAIEEKREYRRMWQEVCIERDEALETRLEMLEGLLDLADVEYGTTGVAIDVMYVIHLIDYLRKKEVE